MIIKLTYGLKQSLPATPQPRNAAKVQPSNVSFHYETTPPCVSFSEALAMMKDGSLVEDKEILLDVTFSKNEEVAVIVNLMKEINFLKQGDEIDICAYIPGDDNYKYYQELDLKWIREETKHLRISSTTYRIEDESALIEIFKSKKVIRSKSWNTAGQIVDNEGDVIPIKAQKPVDFKELRKLIEGIYAHMTNEDYQHILLTCVETKTGHVFSEDGDGWRDYSYYQVRMIEFEKELDRLGYLKPFLRKVSVDNILAELE